ncbi:hypothetical protein DL771_002928 [Monosporascus sp. 5C6A]|nr:hypothetical protein DL771_002928 [Monosporascus sp. 5C6A]
MSSFRHSSLKRETLILHTSTNSLEKFKSFRHSTVDLQHAANMVRIMISSRAGAFLDHVQVGNAFRNLPEGGYIAFELRGQNFGVLVHRGQDIIRFEQFELLARNKDVMNCKGRLLRRFPVELDHTTHPTCRPMVAKGGKEHIEERDTINPRLIALLTGFLRGLGRQGCSTPILKHSREEVLWTDARVSWHRSASWMFVRICLRLVLDRGCEAVQACLYKQFMAFLMSELLQQALSMDIPDHLVYCMAAKVNRRFLKLSSILTYSPGWFAVSSEAVEQAGSKLAAKWTTIQDADKRAVDLEALKDLRFHEDTVLTLVKLKPYLNWISNPSRNLERIDLANSASGFSFTRAEPSSLPNFDPLKVGALAEHIQCYSLADFENWVAENLQGWLLARIDQSNTCEDLARLIDDYYTVANLRYKNNPMNLSIMWITIMELWAACDKSVTNLYPLLKDHRVGLPEGLLEPLLLPVQSQMTRLREVENYLAARHDMAKRDFPSAFEGFGDENSFAARFYETSKQHQELHQQILASAEEARAAKLEELRSQKGAYADLKRRHDSVEHQVVDWKTLRGGWRQECAWDCSKCRLGWEMKNMRIVVHEWPLPEKEVHAKVVVFELQVPSAIVAWRRATMALMVDMLHDPKDPPTPTQCRDPYWALEFPDLKPHAWPPHTRRLQLASVTKPFTKAHYKDIAVAEASEYTYTPGAPWSPMEQDRDHILRSQSATTAESNGLPVSLNLLDGSLLVNGRPLSRLPKEFQDHPTYARLFGTQILEIVPSEFPSMDFSAARKQKGWVVHFAMMGDGLTGRTGTEEALRILKSAAVVSFERLDNEDIRLLSDIASLSPRRQFYPRHLRVMQTVNWSNSLDPLAQSEEFSRVVRSILKCGEDCEMFFPGDAKEIPELNVTDVHLQDRALVRCSTFRVSGFGAEDHNTSFDTLYNGRDTISDSTLLLEQYGPVPIRVGISGCQDPEQCIVAARKTMANFLSNQSKSKDIPVCAGNDDKERFLHLLSSLRARASRVHEREYVDELEKSFRSSQINPDADKMAQFVHDDSMLRTMMKNYVKTCRCQRSERLLAAVGNTNQLVQEMKNVGHTWDPMVFPESLLLEVESGIMIREVQEKIAAPMRNPDQNNNSVMQLNMGEGKSSVIVQIVAASLADGARLVRIIVAKPQSKQMRHMLVTKLGGLLDRQVFFMPFSRSIAMDAAKIQQMRRTLTECMENGGVVLVQPEHLLSFKLMGVEYVGRSPTNASACSTEVNRDATSASGVALTKAESYSIGLELLKTQKFLDQHCRDIIDESDENFSVKFELIYTIGLPVPVEMSPERWIAIQNVLSLVCRCAAEVQKSAPNGIQLQSAEPGQFATLRILEEPAGKILLQLVARTLCEKGVHRLPIAHQNPVIRQAVLNFILDETLTNDNAFLVQNDEKGFYQATKDILLLLRGLFAGGILKFTLSQKRWRVNYGLAERKPPKLVAVPYRAKDSPAPRAEFSHPDIVIVLTCLSYYYNGLCDAQLFTSFEHLQRSDQADEEFANWVKGSAKLPIAFRQLAGINLKDREQCIKDIFPALSFTKAVIDFYLDKVVFPKEMVEFPKKLSASGWDLAKTKSHPVTGFSGTCDSKYVLPLEIQHLELPDQIHTNAMVLNRLLRSENLARELGPNLSSTSLLQSVVQAEPPIQVILDVGALIVELDNEQVARLWLDLSPAHDKQAAIFVNDKDELLVLNRGGFIEPFLTSPFVGDTRDCLVFLDEAHTRGIDLKLPDDYRAAVTLGPRLTKDRLVQACMRMRKLGKGQSVTFFIPQEIKERIRNCASLGTHAPLTVTSVLLWSISETWTDTEKSIPLWAMQGFRHQRQEAIWNNKIAHQSELTIESSDLQGYFEDEAMTLEQRYLPSHQTPGHVFSSLAADNELTERKEQVDRIMATCERYQIASFSSATLSEEQERELAPEMEQERQAERPNLMKPKRHIVHPDVLELVRRGNLNLNGGGFLAAFESFNRSTARRLANPVEFGQELLVTTDFAKAVDLTAESHSDAFHRSVQWVLTFKNGTVGNQCLVILSPWEANELVLEIDKSSYVHLHSYAARRNLSFPTLQDLKLCTTPCIPPDWTSPPKSLILQLNIFAGQLYFEDMTEYKDTCAFLGLSCVPNDGSVTVRADGFVGQGTLYPRCRFTQSPTAFLRVVMSNIRRDCQDISRTHVGRMLAGEILTESDFHTNAI